MKLGKLLDYRFHAALKRLSEQPLSLKVAHALKTINKLVENELVKYEEIRKEGLIRFGKKNDANELIMNDEVIEFEPDQRAKLLTELNDLLSTDISVPRLNLDVLDGVVISVDDLNLLSDIIN